MTKPTEHQHATDDEAREYAVKALSAEASDGVHKFTVVCQICRDAIFRALNIAQDFLDPENIKSLEAGAGENIKALIEATRDILEFESEHYLDGKKTIQEEGLDLSNRDTVLERFELSKQIIKFYHDPLKGKLSIRERFAHLISPGAKKSRSMLRKPFLTPTELDREQFVQEALSGEDKEENVYIYLECLLKKQREVLGDESDLAQYAHLAEGDDNTH